jgi:hypothetical protein
VEATKSAPAAVGGDPSASVDTSAIARAPAAWIAAIIGHRHGARPVGGVEGDDVGARLGERAHVGEAAG